MKSPVARRIVLSSLLLCCAALVLGPAAAAPESGSAYVALATPQPTDSGARIEVTEFFYYSCPFCNALDPALAEWVKRQGDKVVFKRVHVDVHGSTALQRIFYSLEAMGQVDAYHARIFHAVHAEHQPVSTDAEVLQLAARLGIDTARLREVGGSFSIQTKMRRAAQLAVAYKIDGVPMLAVDGRYLTSPTYVHKAHPDYNLAQSNAGVPAVLDQLVEKARALRGAH